jgi:hypothetical protein
LDRAAHVVVAIHVPASELPPPDAAETADGRIASTANATTSRRIPALEARSNNRSITAPTAVLG